MGHLQNPVTPLFWLNNKATAKQKKRTAHFWRPRDAQCRNGRRKIKPVQVLWVTSCLYPVTPHWQLLWLHLEGQWSWQSHNWPTRLPHVTPQETGVCDLIEVFSACWNATLINVLQILRVITLSELSGNSPLDSEAKSIFLRLETHLSDNWFSYIDPT